MNSIWSGMELISSVFFAIEGWFEQLFNGIQEGGLASFLVVMAALVVLFWIVRAVGGAFSGAGSDQVKQNLQENRLEKERIAKDAAMADKVDTFFNNLKKNGWN